MTAGGKVVYDWMVPGWSLLLIGWSQTIHCCLLVDHWQVITSWSSCIHIWKQWMLLFNSFCLIQFYCPWNVFSHINLPNLDRSHRHTWKIISWMTLDPVKLTVNLNHHRSHSLIQDPKIHCSLLAYIANSLQDFLGSDRLNHKEIYCSQSCLSFCTLFQLVCVGSACHVLGNLTAFKLPMTSLHLHRTDGLCFQWTCSYHSLWVKETSSTPEVLVTSISSFIFGHSVFQTFLSNFLCSVHFVLNIHACVCSLHLTIHCLVHLCSA